MIALVEVRGGAVLLSKMLYGGGGSTQKIVVGGRGHKNFLKNNVVGTQKSNDFME